MKAHSSRCGNGESEKNGENGRKRLQDFEAGLAHGLVERRLSAGSWKRVPKPARSRYGSLVLARSSASAASASRPSSA